MIGAFTALLSGVLAVGSPMVERISAATVVSDCPPEGVFEPGRTAPSTVVRDGDRSPFIAPSGIAALQIGPDVLVPVPDLPLRSIVVGQLRGRLLLVVLRFAGEPEIRVTVNPGIYANVKPMAERFGVTLSDMISDYLSTTEWPPCSDTAAIVYRASAEMALSIATSSASTDAKVYWNDVPLRVGITAAEGREARGSTAILELPGSDRRLFVVDWTTHAMEGVELAELNANRWSPQPIRRSDLDALGGGIAVGTYEAVMSSAMDAGVPCVTRYDEMMVDCAAALALIDPQGATSSGSSMRRAGE
jgi:hypothetical protein